MNVFIGGSISFDYLDYTITDELDKYMNGELEIFVGDAYGVDKLVQKYLDKNGYRNVTVYASNGRARNNIGLWKVKAIEVPSDVYGREFYTYKDFAMSTDCNFGFMIWDGKSRGTQANILRLININKGVNVYLPYLRQMKSINDYKDYKKLMEEI